MTGPHDPVARPRAVARPPEDRSLGELLGDVAGDLSTLLRQEVELAKAEVRESGTRAGKGVGLLAGAGVGGFLAVLFVSISLWWGLGHFVDLAWSALIVAALWGIVAAMLMQSGRKELARIKGLPRTTDTVSKIPNALKGNEEENR
ncbi:MAG: phage holin family protein [Micropruina sp.]|nr:phage holin family protein [Micropruina sp.]